MKNLPIMKFKTKLTKEDSIMYNVLFISKNKFSKYDCNILFIWKR